MSRLRSFASYGNVAPAFPFALPCNLVNLDGYAAGVGWLQVHDSAVALTSGVSVPLKSVNISAAGMFPSLLTATGAIPLNSGLCIALSSTEAVYTTVGTSFDVFGEIEEYEIAAVDTTVVGDLTTNVQGLSVWTDAQGPRKLIKLEVTNVDGVGPWYVMIFSTNATVADGTKPFFQSKITSLQALTFNFGINGLDVQRQSAAGVRSDGCTVVISDATGTLTTTVDNFKIRATYKTSQF